MFKRVVTLTLTTALSGAGLIASTASAAAEPAHVTPSTCGAVYGSTNWEEPTTGASIKQLFIRIRVGDDDIRPGTVALARVMINQGGQRILLKEKPLNIPEKSFPNVSLLQAEYDLAAERDGDPETDEDPGIIADWMIKGFAIRYVSGQPDIFSTPDNWNMNDIQVFYPRDDDSGFHSPPDPSADV